VKKVLILGVGAQGSTVAQRLDEESYVGEIICADHDKNAVDSLVQTLKKAKGLKIDGDKYKQILKAVQGVDLVINALPIKYGVNVLEAALEARTNYMDFAVIEPISEQYIIGVKYLYDYYGKRFAEVGKLALIGAGSAPGLVCVVARRAVRELDSCDTINILLYGEMKCKRFIPFWWSPVDALEAMAYEAYAFEDGEHIVTEPFSRPVYRRWPEMDNEEVELVEHDHEEPICMGYNAAEFFKGAKNIYFKYGGSEVEFARPFYEAGLLDDEVDDYGMIPFDYILAYMPPPPKTREEIQEIIDEGGIVDEGAEVIEAYGMKNGKAVMVDAHIDSPGLEEAFKIAGITGEMYVTGQCGFFFSKMILEDSFYQQGLISTDMLSDEQVDRFLDLAAEKDITCTIEIKDQ